MTEEPRPLSSVVPVLLAALVCDVAVVDPSTAKHNLIGVFDSIQVTQFPTQRPMTLYLKLTDAEGYYQIEVKYVRVSSGEILAKARGELLADDRLKSQDLQIPFPPLPMPDEGRYEFQVWFNSMFLGSASVDAIPQPPN